MNYNYNVLISTLILRNDILSLLKLYFQNDNIYDLLDSSNLVERQEPWISYLYQEIESNFPLMLDCYISTEVSYEMELGLAQSIAQKYNCNCIIMNGNCPYTGLMVNSCGKITLVSEQNDNQFKICNDTSCCTNYSCFFKNL